MREFSDVLEKPLSLNSLRLAEPCLKTSIISICSFDFSLDIFSHLNCLQVLVQGFAHKKKELHLLKVWAELH